METSNLKTVYYYQQGYSKNESMTFSEYYERLILCAQKIEPNFILDDNLKDIMKALSLYFWQDPEFEKQGYGSLKKGIMLVGGVGVGKTLLMRVFLNNTIQLLKMHTTNEVADTYQDKGIEALKDHYVSSYNNILKGIVFDDLGIERIPVKHMGNELNVMERVILERYEYKNHRLTHFTSNLDAEEIEKFYGTRVRSRLREMVNMITLKGADRRK